MNRALVNSLPDADRLLLAETEPAALADLSEDGLVALHDRIRRQRNKYTGMYRREAATRVAASGGRGKARPTNTRNRDRAEAYEDALSRVSTKLAAAARRSAAELRAERIQAARDAKAGVKPLRRPMRRQPRRDHARPSPRPTRRRATAR